MQTSAPKHPLSSSTSASLREATIGLEKLAEAIRAEGGPGAEDALLTLEEAYHKLLDARSDLETGGLAAARRAEEL